MFWVTALLSFFACAMVIAFFGRRTRNNTRLEKLRLLRMELRSKFALSGMIVVHFLFWLFLPTMVCRSHLDNSYICLGGDETLVGLIGASLAASVTGFVLGWTVLPWILNIVHKLVIGTGDDFGDFLTYNRELLKAVHEEKSVPRD